MNEDDETLIEVARHVMVQGRVQGVGYRAWTEVAALERRLTGWVRNRRDGSVEAVFIGVQRDVLAMIEDCRTGPPAARVDALYQREASTDDIALRRRDELFSTLPTV